MSHDSSTIWRQLSWRAQTLAYDLVRILVRALPVDAASALGGWVVAALGPLTAKHRIVLRNLEFAFPEKTAEERAGIAAEFWEKVGRTFAE
ncbi:MAG TPA: lipid A biosynthesis acyltransferase, partial [Caulobacteraceae bacterium]